MVLSITITSDVVFKNSWFIPLFFAIYCEARAVYISFIIKSKYNINIPRNFIGRTEISSLNYLIKNSSRNEIRKRAAKLITFKKWMFIWMGVAIFIFLFVKYNAQ